MLIKVTATVGLQDEQEKTNRGDLACFYEEFTAMKKELYKAFDI